MDRNKANNVRRTRRQFRVRNRLRKQEGRQRMCVFRSHKHMYVQIVDDFAGRTLASASTLESDLRSSYGGNKDAAAAVGKAIAQKALAAGVDQVAFDRGPYRYHGRIAALADAAREAGLKF